MNIIDYINKKIFVKPAVESLPEIITNSRHNSENNSFQTLSNDIPPPENPYNLKAINGQANDSASARSKGITGESVNAPSASAVFTGKATYNTIKLSSVNISIKELLPTLDTGRDQKEEFNTVRVMKLFYRI